ncbi:disease resistance protein-like [Dorcoceras hygrometricum]|uniref:Disease resistance protein-like n=1 Tax=Dorcoceras hygrometricum TaxID=472368 RepID=A0A2Z7BLM6_9LAMI|nr:disease resistance protein-like [Dorcoceras hygrometricum]
MAARSRPRGSSNMEQSADHLRPYDHSSVSIRPKKVVALPPMVVAEKPRKSIFTFPSPPRVENPRAACDHYFSDACALCKKKIDFKEDIFMYGRSDRVGRELQFPFSVKEIKGLIRNLWKTISKFPSCLIPFTISFPVRRTSTPPFTARLRRAAAAAEEKGIVFEEAMEDRLCTYSPAVSNFPTAVKEKLANSFSIVIWVTVSKHTNNRKIQTRLFERLELEMRNEESDERVTSRLLGRLKNEECFLLILDDVWAYIDLQKLGIPNAEDCPRCKIIITSRSAKVCRQMSTEDAIVMVGTLDDEEAWELFQKHSGEVAMREDIRAVARDVAKECAGLPLALVTVGASMKGMSDVRLWENARTTLRMSAPDIISIEEKVFKPLKSSYDSLPNDITRYCFLFCCLYPEDFEICVEELVRYWCCEGLFHERLNYKEIENRGIAIIRCLTDCCLLEKVDESYRKIKVHDVVRDVGIWIANSNGSQCRSVVRSGIQLTRITNEEFSHSFHA